ncbi:MAG: hypothetical protein ACLUGU_05930 [Alistipes shahii]
MFRQVISSIFSWQTALVVGITLLTAYGKEIGAWVKGLFSAGNALSDVAQYTQDLNRAIENSRSELKRSLTPSVRQKGYSRIMPPPAKS